MNHPPKTSVVTAILNVNDLEAVSLQKTRQTLPGKVVQMRWRMDHPPSRPSQSCVQTFDVTCCDGQQCAGARDALYLFDVSGRIG